MRVRIGRISDSHSLLRLEIPIQVRLKTAMFPRGIAVNMSIMTWDTGSYRVDDLVGRSPRPPPP